MRAQRVKLLGQIWQLLMFPPNFRKYSAIVSIVKLLGVIEIFEFFNLKVNKLLFIICITFLEKNIEVF